MKFSVTIPAYKRKYLLEAIESVLAQTYQDYELIIVDDCSPEDLKSVVDKFSDSRIHYYRNKKNCGAINVVDNWNICLSYCMGDYVICMGDDDRLLPNCLKEYVNIINKYPDLYVYHAWTEIINEDGNYLDIQHPRPEYESALSLMWNRWNGRNRQYIGDFCYEIKNLRNNGGYFKLPLAWASDDITAVRAASKGIANTQVITFQYRETLLSISSADNHDIKQKAIIKEHSWYESYLNSLKPQELSDNDLRYFFSIKKMIEDHFTINLEKEISSHFRLHPLSVFTYFIKSSKMGLSSKNIFKCILKAFRYKIYG